MTNYESMAREMDKFADFLAAHFRHIKFVPPRSEVKAVVAQYAVLIKNSRGVNCSFTQRLIDRGMQTYDLEIGHDADEDIR